MSRYLELFTGSFDESIKEKCKYENRPYVAYSLLDKYVIFTQEDKYLVYEIVKKDISDIEYNMVDLGLSVKWADRNIGSSSPEEYGSYFQWGDTTPYTFNKVGEITATKMAEILSTPFGDQYGVITKDNIKNVLEDIGINGVDLTVYNLGVVVDKIFNWMNYKYCDSNSTSLTKYCMDSSYGKDGFVDNKNILETNDDAAFKYLGNNCRIPTFGEIEELINNTTPTFVDIQGNEFTQEEAQNGVIKQENLKGVRLTSNINGNSIFIPAAGSCGETLLHDNKSTCCLWSSYLSYNKTENAIFLYATYSGILKYLGSPRYYGAQVRGVCE